ncbi:MAG TPA: GntR family transcriptional regulator [Bryobacteraceae bacterium]|nr:GntR family transcriptional regulator [Bryobacteraceae bacterium]
MQPKAPQQAFLKTSGSSSQSARATLRLREMILDGQFRRGEHIKEIPLAARLKVSRIPLRLALERLAHEGLLELRPTRGFVVQQFSTTDIYDAIELRGILEGSAARLAAERLRDARDLAPLRDANRELDALLKGGRLSLDKFTDYIEINAQFHSALLDLARSKILRRALQQACALPFASPSAFLLKQHASSSSKDLFLIALDQHHAIADAILNREGMRADLLAREHARLARRNLDAALQNRELLKVVRGSKLIQL